MPQMGIIQHRNSTTFLTYSWTTGVKPAKTPKRVMTDSDALAHALYLARQGRSEEAESFLNEYCK